MVINTGNEMYSKLPNLVLGFHGCHKKVFDSVIKMDSISNVARIIMIGLEMEYIFGKIVMNVLMIGQKHDIMMMPVL